MKKLFLFFVVTSLLCSCSESGPKDYFSLGLTQSQIEEIAEKDKLGPIVLHEEMGVKTLKIKCMGANYKGLNVETIIFEFKGDEHMSTLFIGNSKLDINRMYDIFGRNYKIESGDVYVWKIPDGEARCAEVTYSGSPIMWMLNITKR